VAEKGGDYRNAKQHRERLKMKITRFLRFSSQEPRRDLGAKQEIIANRHFTATFIRGKNAYLLLKSATDPEKGAFYLGGEGSVGRGVKS
jgi:hypothetical protein